MSKRKAICFPLACATVALAAALLAGERPDPRTRTLLDPVRAWGSIDAAALTTPKFGQVAEGEFLVGSGPVLKRGEWVILDFGRELHGGVQIGSGAKSGTNALAHVRFGESVSEAMSELGERGACNDHAIRDDVVRLPWYGRREIGETGFRFVRIDNAGDDPLQLDYVRAVSVMRPMKRLGGFKSSDPRLNQVFETAVRTVHLCCQDYLWDGVKRDRLVWMGDTHPETMAILAVFGAADVLPDSLDYMAATTPAEKWMNTMPTYALWWIRNLAEWYRYTGDLAYLTKHADYLEKTFAHVLEGMDARGMWTAGNFLDWPTKHNDEAATAGTQGLALVAARETAFLAKELGRAALQEKAEAMAKRLSALRPDPHGAKSAAALLALSGLRSPREMFDGVIGKDGHAGVSTFYGYYMLEAMSAANEGQRALDTVRDYWGGMLDMGATSFWEDFNLAWTNGAFRIDEPRVAGKKDVHGDYGDFCYQGFRHSLCHGWSAGPAAWCVNHVLGIRPLDVGCKTVEVRPFLGDLDWAEGSMALPDGRSVGVRVEKRADGTITTRVDAPDDVKIVKSTVACERSGDRLSSPASPVSAAEFVAAQPVWPAGRETERNLFVGFRATVDGSAKTLRYSASSIARVWLNGRFLAYGPARGPHGLDRIDEIPIEGLVTNGVNTLAFEVVGYNVESFYLLNEPAYLAAEVTDGAGRILASTAPHGAFESFVLTERVQKVPRFSYQRPFCEIYALTPASTAWRTGAVRTPCAELAAVAGSPWTDRMFPYPDYTVSTEFRPLKGGRLERRAPAKLHPGRSVTGESQPSRGYAESEIAIQPVREIQCLPSVDAHPVESASAYAFDAKSYVLFDHGLNDTGFLGARVVCRKPGRVYFHFDEVLKDGDIDVARMDWQCVNALTYDFTEPGEYAIEAFEPNTFRYLKVMSDTFEGDVADLFVRAYKNGEAKAATFRSTDPALDRIFDAAKETFVQNAVDAFTDCPSRERAGWLCDSFFSGRTAALLTGNTSVERGFLGNYAKCPKTLEGGFLPMCYPADAGLLPNWNFWLILELKEYLARSGDRALVDEMKPKVLGIIEAFRRFRNGDGLLENLPGWVFIEWSRANDLVKDVNYPTNMTYAEVLEAVTRLYGLPEYAAEAARVREMVRRQSWTGEWFCDNAVRQADGSLRLSGECTETCQYYAFFFRTATPETYPQLWERLVRDFGPQRRTTRKYPQIHFANAFIGNYLRLELLSRAGLARQILDETKGYFLGMAEKTGTLWEHDNVSNSCDHGFASHVALMLVRDVLGMSVDPRTGEVRYRPTDAELKGGVVTLPTAKGPLELAWRRGGRIEYGKPLVVDFGAQGEGGYPAAVVASVDGRDVKLRLSYSTHPKGLGERGDFWHETRATYLGPDVLLPILPASTDRFDVFAVSGPGTVRAAKCQGLVRYLRIAVDTPGAAVDVDKVVLENRAVHAVDPVVGSFDCSDPELAKIWRASVRTCQLSSVPSYEATHVTPAVTTLPYLADGAKRDRLVWSGDLWWAQRNMYAAFGPKSPYLPGSLDMLAENQTPAGYINACPYPESRGPITAEFYGPFGSDEFAAWFVPVLADHCLYTGDRALLERRYPNAVKVLDYLAAHQAADGLFDQRAETAKHSEGLAVGGTSLHHRTYMHLLLWRANADAARMATWLGRPDDATRFTAAAARLETLLRTRFFRPDLGRFGLSLEQPDAPAFVANAAALAFGFLKGDEAKGVLAQLTHDTHGKFQMMAIRGAFELRDGAKAMELLNAHNWRVVVSDGWEGTHLTSECMNLLREGWGDEAHPDTALAGVLTDYILGVRPTAPGYETYVFDPIPVPGITWARGVVPTACGCLQVEWSLKNGRIEKKIVKK